MRTNQMALWGAAGGAALFAAGRLLRARRRIDFAGRSVIITGGSRGLGLELARRFARQGARLTLIARDPNDLDAARRQLERESPDAHSPLAIPCDVTDAGLALGAVQAAVDHHGRLDVLINNAGTIQVGPVDHMRLVDFEDAMATHCWGALHMMRAAIPHMRRERGGRIVNIASIGGLIAVPHLAPYAASKFALVGLSDALRAELLRDGIRVTTVCPGLMRTGSPLNATFKGQHRAEYTWFAIADNLPLVSMDSGRAADKIVDACRHGDARLLVGAVTKLAAAAQALAPGAVAAAMATTNRLLPDPHPTGGQHSFTGWDSRTRWAPSRLTRSSNRATVVNNELRGHAPEELAAHRNGNGNGHSNGGRGRRVR
jgi:NAD(P)-dependent dehydrogenase (short-subunit alcohol dehydrogenase family)